MNDAEPNEYMPYLSKLTKEEFESLINVINHIKIKAREKERQKFNKLLNTIQNWNNLTWKQRLFLDKQLANQSQEQEKNLGMAKRNSAIESPDPLRIKDLSQESSEAEKPVEIQDYETAKEVRGNLASSNGNDVYVAHPDILPTKMGFIELKKILKENKK